MKTFKTPYLGHHVPHITVEPFPLVFQFLLISSVANDPKVTTETWKYQRGVCIFFFFFFNICNTSHILWNFPYFCDLGRTFLFCFNCSALYLTGSYLCVTLSLNRWGSKRLFCPLAYFSSALPITTAPLMRACQNCH